MQGGKFLHFPAPTFLTSLATFHPVNAKVKFSAIVRIFCFQDNDDAFFVCDLGDIVQKYNLWKSELPRVEPHYGSCLLTVATFLGYILKLSEAQVFSRLFTFKNTEHTEKSKHRFILQL